MATKQEIEFRARVNEVRRDIASQSKNIEKQVLAGVKSLQDDTVKALVNLTPEQWGQSHLPQLFNVTTAASNRLQQEFNTFVIGETRTAFELGVKLADTPFQVMNVTTGVFGIDLQALQLASVGLSDLVTDVSNQLRTSINGNILRGIGGNLSNEQIISNIGRQITAKGPFKTAEARAEAIAITETSRVNNIANDERLVAVNKNVPGVNKQWVWSGVSRLTHAAVHGIIRKAKETFTVAGEQLLHPVDPNGSAFNTVRCGCTTVAHMTGWPKMDFIDPKLTNFAEESIKKGEIIL